MLVLRHLLVFALCAMAVATAQECPPALKPPPALPNAAPSALIHRDVHEVSITFSVTDHNGRAIHDVVSHEITVLDEHQPVQARYFSRDSRAPLRLGVLVDWSESVADRYAFERQVATEFLHTVMRANVDDGFVLGFGARPQLLQPLTSDPEEMIKALRPVRDSWLTSLYDAVAEACSGPMAEPPLEAVRRAILLLSDGQDNDSAADLAQAIAAAQRTDVVIYAVARRGRDWNVGGERTLLELAAATGGRTYIVDRAEQYREAFVAIEQELRSSYRVSFEPSGPRDGRFHTVQIAVRGGSVRVHARPGYFAPKE